MIIQCFDDIFKKYKSHIIYIHNLSNFDSVYLLKVLYKKYKINTLFKDGKTISINSFLKFKENNKIKTYKLSFNDSLMLLPLSLEKLIDAFSLKKTSFSL
jgi:DNA polymerase elongation subunit (family B)